MSIRGRESIAIWAPVSHSGWIERVASLRLPGTLHATAVSSSSLLLRGGVTAQLAR